MWGHVADHECLFNFLFTRRLPELLLDLRPVTGGRRMLINWINYIVVLLNLFSPGTRVEKSIFFKNGNLFKTRKMHFLSAQIYPDISSEFQCLSYQSIALKTLYILLFQYFTIE